MQNTVKAAMSLILSFLLIFCIIQPAFADTVASGTCGSNVT